MPSKKQEIRKQVKKKLKKEGMEHQELNQEAEIVDLGDHRGDDIIVESFDDIKTDAKPLPFSTTPQKEKKGITGRIKSIFSQDSSILRKLEKQADEIIAIEPQAQAMSDEELCAQTQFFKDRLAKGETLDDILPEAFAVVREAAYRVLGLKAFKVQLMGAISLHNGDIAEMKTGEGKTLTSIFPVYLNALDGKGVHVVTVNEYLARRDCELNGQVYKFLGLTVGLNERELDADDKRKQHACDITYTTNAELGFDYLRDNMVTNYEDKVLRPLHYALVDEVDSILIDESRTPLIISGGKKKTASMYISADHFAKSLKNEKDYQVDVESKTCTLTPDGIAKAEKAFNVENLYDPQNTALVHYINQALKANYTMTKDIEYMIATEDGSHDIRNASIMIIDQFTGRVMPGRAYSDGLHQAIEAKEGVPIKEETVTLATITYQNFFRLFDKLAGMTGTAKTEEEEFRQIYNMRVVVIPTNKPVIRDDKPDLVFSSKKAKYAAIIREVEMRHAYGQPILLGTVAVETSEILSKMLSEKGIKHNTLNAKNHAKEAAIIAKAGVKGAVTIATNMAGRGTDIVLEDGVAELGGLKIIGTERHESRRIDNQLRGRAGRQGDPGESKFYLSLEDDLMRLFGSERMISIYNALGIPEGEEIQHKTISKTIEKAQKKIENNNFGIRKNLLDYDRVNNEQREVMYKERRRVLDGDDMKESVLGMMKETVANHVYQVISDELPPEEWDLAALNAELLPIVPLNKIVLTDAEKSSGKVDDLVARLQEETVALYEQKEKEIEDFDLREIERIILLKVIDRKWMDHIDDMDQLREGIGLQAYGQRDPVVEYRMAGFEMFNDMTKAIQEETTGALFHVQVEQKIEREEAPKITGTNKDAEVEKKPYVRKGAKVGRNDPCPCGSGKKYKNCCGRNK